MLSQDHVEKILATKGHEAVALPQDQEKKWVTMKDKMGPLRMEFNFSVTCYIVIS